MRDRNSREAEPWFDWDQMPIIEEEEEEEEEFEEESFEEEEVTEEVAEESPEDIEDAGDPDAEPAPAYKQAEEETMEEQVMADEPMPEQVVEHPVAEESMTVDSDMTGGAVPSAGAAGMMGAGMSEQAMGGDSGAMGAGDMIADMNSDGVGGVIAGESVIVDDSIGSRISQAISGVLVGVVLFLASFVVLFWNEGCAVKRYAQALETARNTVKVTAETVNPANDGKLLLVQGEAVSSDVLRDPALGISVNGLKLVRKVEMFQWEEQKKTKTEKKLVKGKTQKVKTTYYEYKKVWSTQLINSGEFKQDKFRKVTGGQSQNPATMPLESDRWYADTVTVGAFTLPHGLIQKLPAEQSLSDAVLAGEQSSGSAEDQKIIEVTPQTVSESDNGKRCYLTGPMTMTGYISDSRMNVTVKAPVVRRVVEVYQWLPMRDGTIKRGFAEQLYNSSRLDPSALAKATAGYAGLKENPKTKPLDSQTFYAADVNIGKYKLSQAVLKQLKPDVELALNSLRKSPDPSKGQIGVPPSDLNGYRAVAIKGKEFYLLRNSQLKAPTVGDVKVSYRVLWPTTVSVLGPLNTNTLGGDHPIVALGVLNAKQMLDRQKVAGASGRTIAGKPVQRHGKGFYIGSNPADPRIGDLKVTYGYAASPMKVTVNAEQAGNSFVAYQGEYGETFDVFAGTLSAKQIKAKKDALTATITWVVRIVGWLMMLFGIMMVLNPIAVLLDAIPFIGGLASTAASLVSLVIALMISIPLSLITICIAWLYYRPLIAVPVLVVMLAALGVGVFMLIKGIAARKAKAAVAG